MPIERTAAQVLDAQFLEMRHRVLSLAADLDRLSHATNTAALSDDQRVSQLNRALDLLRDDGTDRAQRVQMVFSDAYDSNWRSG